MKKSFPILLIFIFTASVFAQKHPDLQKLVDTERAFARSAAENGTKKAFLDYMTNDGVVFVPEEINARKFWEARADSKSLLSWEPNYADISANGIIGYTTGNWEYRANGKGDTPSAFGDFITVWLKYPTGYKWVVDIGVSHDKPAKYSSDWVTSADTAVDPNDQKSSAADVANEFFEVAARKGFAKAYEVFAAQDIRIYRENKMPILGKNNAISEAKSQGVPPIPAKRSTMFGSANLAYTNNKYSIAKNGKIVENGNFLQIWKLKAGKWQLVLDIYKPIPAS